MDCNESYCVIDALHKQHFKPELDLHGQNPGWWDGSFYPRCYAMEMLTGTVSNGGWPAVYYNRLGWAVSLARDGFHRINAHGLAAVCDLAIEKVVRAEQAHSSVNLLSENWLSSGLMEAIGQNGWNEIDQLWEDAVKHEDWLTLSAKYIIENGLLKK